MIPLLIHNSFRRTVPLHKYQIIIEATPLFVASSRIQMAADGSNEPQHRQQQSGVRIRCAAFSSTRFSNAAHPRYFYLRTFRPLYWSNASVLLPLALCRPVCCMTACADVCMCMTMTVILCVTYPSSLTFPFPSLGTNNLKDATAILIDLHRSYKI